MNLFKKNKENINTEDIKQQKETAELRKKKLENVLALQKRHPFLDRFLMLAGIAAIIIIAIPFIYISFELSVFNLIGGGFNDYMTGNETTTGMLQLFEVFGTSMVPIFQIPWSQASWLFCLVGTILFIAIILGLAYLTIIYIRDFATIIKGIILMLSKNTENVGVLIKDQVADTKNIAATSSDKKTKKKTKKTEKDISEEKQETKSVEPKTEEEQVDDIVEKVKKDLAKEKSSSILDYEHLTDEELDKLLNNKK